MPQATSNHHAEIWQEIVRQKMAGLRFGSIEIVVHEGRATLMQTTEKIRFNTDSVTVPGRQAGHCKL